MAHNDSKSFFARRLLLSSIEARFIPKKCSFHFSHRVMSRNGKKTLFCVWPTERSTAEWNCCAGQRRRDNGSCEVFSHWKSVGLMMAGEVGCWGNQYEELSIFGNYCLNAEYSPLLAKVEVRWPQQEILLQQGLLRWQFSSAARRFKPNLNQTCPGHRHSTKGRRSCSLCWFPSILWWRFDCLWVCCQLETEICLTKLNDSSI